MGSAPSRTATSIAVPGPSLSRIFTRVKHLAAQRPTSFCRSGGGPADFTPQYRCNAKCSAKMHIFSITSRMHFTHMSSCHAVGSHALTSIALLKLLHDLVVCPDYPVIWSPISCISVCGLTHLRTSFFLHKWNGGVFADNWRESTSKWYNSNVVQPH
ncbi:uncharacterized protein CC84DRAFT_976466 [Paraphaeosphaeria sporulosa]|uniref:Uncharacterized protein n=1 Tax=Paraphaeosphaeria sporulosa TaxID=1460663 RepID=A0A177C5H7_9PLEO|nr:uncharacterized protein CC84DRAFT_976466 [Paraphaeosphaeria sporulosa]OAG01977.1 hypothetical protein CC84DRAFT_976466 [Paraphaeosphaeria sporulosa]